MQWPFETRWIFFDVGDTLVDESAAVKESVRQFVEGAKRIGIDIAEAQVLQELGQGFARFEPMPMWTLMAKLVPEAGDLQTIRAGMKYRKELEQPYPASKELLRQLSSSGYKLGIIANQSVGTADRLAAYGFTAYLSVLISSAEAGVAKPDPAIFLLALEEAGCPPEEAVMIGDRIDNDVIPSKRLGMRAIRVRQGLAKAQTDSIGADAPDASLDRIADVAALFGI